MWVYLSLVSLLCCGLPCLCGEHPDGESQVSRAQDAEGNYHFSYNVANSEGEQFREEGTDALGRVIGSYGLKHVDGTHRVVDYIADKNGFRASVRSNEPGLASVEAADASIVKTDHSIPLTVAATSDDQARQVFGRRLGAETSQVEYVGEEGNSKSNDELARESRQQNFDDYRPLNPVAYYPSDSRNPLHPSPVRSPEPGRTPRVLQPSNAGEDSKPLDVYLPPIDPHTAVRRPPYYVPRDRPADGNFISTTTSRKPYVPPYGGFDDDEESFPLSPESRAGVGVHFPIATPPPALNGRRFLPPVSPENRNFDAPRFPPNSRIPPRHHVAPTFPQHVPPQGVLFSPPSYDGRIGSPNVVLRAVPIPNGIQAVRVDPSTGRIYERLVYPLFLRHDGHAEYDRNILLHNDDVSDDDRHDDPSYLDMPYVRTPYRGARNHPVNDEEGRRFRTGPQNRSHWIDEHTLSLPSAADIAWLKKQLSLIEGFDGERFGHSLPPTRLPHRDSNFHRDDDFFDGEHRHPVERGIPDGPRTRPNSDLLSYSSETEASRDKRNNGDLAPESSKSVSETVLSEDGNVEKENDKNISEIKTP